MFYRVENGRVSRYPAAAQGADRLRGGNRHRRANVLRLLHVLGHLQARQHARRRDHALPWWSCYVSILYINTA